MKRETAAIQAHPALGALPAVLKRLRADARCANELERGHVPWRLGWELGAGEKELLGLGFERAHRRIVEDA